MNKTNCKNCGAALDIWSPKCEFCGTRNINLTSLDLASGEPVNFIFKMPSNIKVVNKENQEVYLTTLAIPSLDIMTITSEPTNIYGGWSNVPLVQYPSSATLEIGLKLTSVNKPSSDGKDTLCELRYGG